MIKFQTLAIIFVLIVVPITMLLTYYINSQIDTIAIQNSYDTKLLNSTYDAIIALQLNTINNNGYSTNAEALRRDINASINTFTTSLAKNFGTSGAGKNEILPYIPALVYTLYDGYYIYSPVTNTTVNDGDVKTTYEHTLKPYVYYTARYYKENGTYDFVVNYSLDNYIAIYGNINGTYYSKAGYLTYIKKYEDISLSGDAYTYFNNNNVEKNYINTKEFSIWVQENLKDITAQDIVVEVTKTGIKTAAGLDDDKNPYYEFKGNENEIFKIDENNDPEVKTSAFCKHKNAVIKKSIQSNLNSAINSYTKKSEGQGTTYDFKMPILSETEWDKVLSNVSIISFMQGLQVGLKTYNNYMIVSSTGNRMYVDPEELYFVTTDPNDLVDDANNPGQKKPKEVGTYYHRINCPLLAKEIEENSNLLVEGFVNLDFKGTYTEKDEHGHEINKYVYNHTALACYECIVSSKVGGLIYDTEDKDIDSNGVARGRTYATNANNNLITFVTKTNTGTDYTGYYNDSDVVEKLRNAYYNALFKERFNLIKVSSYINKLS